MNQITSLSFLWVAAGIVAVGPAYPAHGQPPRSIAGQAPIAPNVTAGFAPAPGRSQALRAGALLPGPAPAVPGPGLPPEQLPPESPGAALGAEMGKAAVTYQRAMNEYTEQELSNTLRVIKSGML